MTQVTERLYRALEALPNGLQQAVEPWVRADGFRGLFSAAQIRTLQQTTGLEVGALMEALLPLAAAYARVPISQFSVGVWVQGRSGALYAGANQEYRGQGLGMTVHAEQAAVTHAWQEGETELTRLTVSAAPCGHCRQFLNELNQAQQLQVHICGHPVQPLAALLPSAFGPADLQISARLLAPEHQPLHLPTEDPLVNAVRQAAETSHAPYTGNHAACGLVLSDGTLVLGRVAENAAFNPTMQPLQAALLSLRWRRLPVSAITRAILVETDDAASSLADNTTSLLKALGEASLEVHRATGG